MMLIGLSFDTVWNNEHMPIRNGDRSSAWREEIQRLADSMATIRGPLQRMRLPWPQVKQSADSDWTWLVPEESMFQLRWPGHSGHPDYPGLDGVKLFLRTLSNGSGDPRPTVIIGHAVWQLLKSDTSSLTLMSIYVLGVMNRNVRTTPDNCRAALAEYADTIMEPEVRMLLAEPLRLWRHDDGDLEPSLWSTTAYGVDGSSAWSWWGEWPDGIHDAEPYRPGDARHYGGIRPIIHLHAAAI